MEPQLLKLLRNLWYYIVLFGLAPPIQKVPASSKSASLSRSQVTMSRSQQTMNGAYAISGPYLLSPDWSAAIFRLTLATPPLVSSGKKYSVSLFGHSEKKMVLCLNTFQFMNKSWLCFIGTVSNKFCTSNLIILVETHCMQLLVL